MRLRYLDRSSEHNSTIRMSGVACIVGGAALAAAAAIGILSNEARSPEEAIGSINIADHTYFVEGGELPLVGLGAIGLVSVVAGVELVRRRDEE